MSLGDSEIWVCAVCRSVNNSRAKQCYKCRTPRELAAVDPSQIAATGHGQLREVALPAFKRSRVLAVIASVLILAVAALQAISVLAASGVILDFLETKEIDESQLGVVGILALANLGVALVALVAWAAWLSRLVVQMPALGLGYPAASGFMAFFENFIPVYNLFRVPAIVRDVVRRLDATPGRGEALISAAFIGIYAGVLIPRVGGFLVRFGGNDIETQTRNQVTLAAIATGCVIVGALFLVWLIWWIESRITTRRAEQVAGRTTATPTGSTEPGTVPPAPSEAETALVARPPAGDADAQPLVGAAVAPESHAATGLAALGGTRIVPGTTATPAVTQAPFVLDTSGIDADAKSAMPIEPTATDPEATLAGGPHLVILVGADGKLMADLDGEQESIARNDVPKLAEVLARAGGTAAVRSAAPGDSAGTVGHEIYQILRDAGVPTTFGD